MNFIQSPPRFGNESPQNGNITAQNGNFQWFSGIFLRAGERHKIIDMNIIKEILTNSNPFSLFCLWLLSDYDSSL